MAIDLCVDGFDDEDDGGDAPLIRELYLHDLASRVPQDLLEPSQPSTGHDHTADHTAPDPSPQTPAVNTQGGETEVLTRPEY